MSENQSVEDQIRVLRKLGKEGKLWKIEVLCNVGPEVKRHKLSNQTDDQVWRFRNNIYKVGLMLPIDPGHWIVIAPWHIKSIDMYKQDSYHEDSWKDS